MDLLIFTNIMKQPWKLEDENHSKGAFRRSVSAYDFAERRVFKCLNRSKKSN